MAQDEVQQWLTKAQEVRKGQLDLSKDEDLSIALMNLISLEEHFYFTAMKTSNQKYIDMLQSVRELRIRLLKKMVTKPEGEEWCISKHLLAASMRLIEVGTKELSKDRKEAESYFASAFDLYSLFFAINLKMIGVQKLEDSKKPEERGSNRMMRGFSAMVKKIVDCCKEW
ncbi:MAG TPA: hypothetical protein VJB08_06720 [Candidatus Nanoarchaeia archaeon]|nr:hypothetical protein [Candidatus Nanoarchaeia archaeon]